MPEQKCPRLTKTEQKEFFSKLKDIQKDSSILSMVYTTEASLDTERRIVRKLPMPLTDLMDEKYVDMSDTDLAVVCADMFPGAIKITEDEAEYLEESTKLQSQCLLWFKYRTGRITASKFAAVSRANLVNPPMSLVKQILNTTSFDSSRVPALHWGITNEPRACNAYLEKSSNEHDGLSFEPAGLFINTTFPHLGASPDGLVSCRCCGNGLIEIKCPYKHRDKHPTAVIDNSFCLQPCHNGDIILSRSHPYYIQIQGQLAVCKREYCDFVCWTSVGMHVERITRDQTCFDGIKPTLDILFFRDILLPQLKGTDTQQKNLKPTCNH